MSIRTVRTRIAKLRDALGLVVPPPVPPEAAAEGWHITPFRTWNDWLIAANKSTDGSEVANALDVQEDTEAEFELRMLGGFLAYREAPSVDNTR